MKAFALLALLAGCDAPVPVPDPHEPHQALWSAIQKRDQLEHRIEALRTELEAVKAEELAASERLAAISPDGVIK